MWKFPLQKRGQMEGFVKLFLKKEFFFQTKNIKMLQMLQKNRGENEILERRISSNRKGFEFPRGHS